MLHKFLRKRFTIQKPREYNKYKYIRHSDLQLLCELLSGVVNIPVKIIMAIHRRNFSVINFATMVSSRSMVDLQSRAITYAKFESTNFVKCV
jgi:hypothetical protein